MTNTAHPPPAAPSQRLLIGKLNAQSLASKLMRDHYLELQRASETRSQKIAWCSSVGPAELLRGMGFLVYFPENHAAMLGAARQSSDLMRYAGAEGYAPEICSYLRSDIGAFRHGTTALSRIDKHIAAPPAPDVLVYNTNQCRDIQDWFSWYGRKLGVPCIGIQSARGVDAVTNDYVEAVAKQIERLIPDLEHIRGAKLDMDRLAEVTDLSLQCSVLWRRALEAARRRPSPISFHTALTLMGPVVTGRGTRATVDFLKALNDELDIRIARHIPAVKDERHRIYWEGMPVWGRLSEMNRLFSGLRTVIAASTYCNSWIFDSLDPTAPLRSMARAYTELFIVRSDEVKERYIAAMATMYDVDGIVFHEAKTCPNNSNTRYGMPERLRQTLEVPVLILQGDHVDPGLFDTERAALQVEAFVEGLAQRRIPK